MKELLKKISESKALALAQMTGVSVVRVEKLLRVDIDESATPYEKSTDKDYSLFEQVHFSDEYTKLYRATLYDYGVEIDGELMRNVAAYSSRELEYRIDSISRDEACVQLRGSANTNAAFLASATPVAMFDIVGLSNDAADKLTFLSELVLEGYVLEETGNLKTSFFTYFSAIETLTSEFIEIFKKSIPKELHHATEHLALDEKLRIVARINVKELEKIALWGGLMESFKKVKDIRNDIAHGTRQTKVTQEDVDQCFICLATIYALLKKKCERFKDVRDHLYPKAMRQRLPKDFDTGTR
ncbi:hypothetical protein [Paraburkholderia sp. BR13444]|uniref:hypothetical protein n=1 Tax=Paraburkholderia sp. BR13444 TaxID=3236997 RepID=UPI0034CE8447